MKIESQVSWLEAPYELTFKTELLDSQKLKENEVLCETLYSAISPGTEIAAYRGMAPLRPGKIYPRLVGYCNVSRVLACGSEVSAIKTGDRILTGACHRDYFTLRSEDILAIIPDEVSSEHAACTYLYHLGYDALLKSSVQYGTPLVIIGLGVLGLAAVSLAVNAGAKVYAISNHPIPAEKAIAIGATGVYSRQNSDELLNNLGTRLADAVITTTNSWDDWEAALKLTGRNGVISVIGFPGRGGEAIPRNPLDSQYFYAKQLRIQAVGMSPSELDKREFLKFNERENIQFLLSQIATQKLNPDFLISGMYPGLELKNAYEDLIARKNSPLTYLLKWKK